MCGECNLQWFPKILRDNSYPIHKYLPYPVNATKWKAMQSRIDTIATINVSFTLKQNNSNIILARVHNSYIAANHDIRWMRDFCMNQF